MLNANAYSFMQNWHLLIRKLLQKNFSTDKRKKNKQKEEETDFFLGGWEMTMHLIFQIY